MVSDDGNGATGLAEGHLPRLRRFPVFADLGPESLSELAEAMRERRWQAGQLIFSRGDAGDHLFAITSGRIRLSLSTPQGREIVLRSLGPGEVLGEMSLIDGEPRSADATAIEETACLTLPRARFDAAARRWPDVGMAISRHLSAHLRRTNFQMESIALYDLQTRLVRFLLHSLSQQPGAGAGNPRRLVLGISQSDIASILGASRPRVSHGLQALADQGAIRRDGRAYLCDIDLLTALSEGDDD